MSTIGFVVIIINNFQVLFGFWLQLRNTGRLGLNLGLDVWMKDCKVGDKTDVNTDTTL